MPAIVGVVSLTSRPPNEAGRAMLEAMARYGPDGSRERAADSAYFGAQFSHTVPEDDFDGQPYSGGGGRYLLTADARVDNRQEVASALDIPVAALAKLSDTSLIVQGWEKWGPAVLDRLLGDIALAVWDKQNRELFLARTPLSSRPIFYCHRPDFIAFASLPLALFAIPEVDRIPNLDSMADLLAGGIYRPGSRTMFRGIESVPQGEALLLREGSRRSTKLWSLQLGPSTIGVEEAGEAMRAELDRAVAAQSRRRGGRLACQLSGGRDSSAVVTSASAQGLEPLALTAAPRADFQPIDDRYWLADESAIAVDTAERSGVDHLVCRSEPAGMDDLLRKAVATHFQPMGNPVNLPWIRQTYSLATHHQAGVLLTGGCGNFALSLGGPGFLGEYRRDRGLGKWMNLARDLHGEGMAWRSLMSLSFGYLLPAKAYYGLWRLSGRGGTGSFELPILKGGFRRQAEQIRKARLGDVRPPASRRSQFAEILAGLENGDKFSLHTFGVDVRDPTADRRFIELCYSLPVEAFLAPGQARPAYAAAFGSRLPDAVINGRQAGYQAADWFETIAPEELRNAFRSYARHPIVEDIVDLGAAEALIDRWPVERGNSLETYDVYCNQLIGTLALASFIDIHFPA